MTYIKPLRGNAPDDNAWLPELMRRMGAIYAAREAASPTPAPPPPPGPWVDKPGTLIAAEKEVFGWELVAKLQPLLCRSIDPCKDHWCRRRKQCRRLVELAPDIEASRANLAAEQAKWQPPSTPFEPPRTRKRRR